MATNRYADAREVLANRSSFKVNEAAEYDLAIAILDLCAKLPDGEAERILKAAAKGQLVDRKVLREAEKWYDTPPDEREPSAEILAELVEAVR